MKGKIASGLAVSACALTVTSATALSTPAAAAPGKHRLILAPRSGKGVPAKPVKIRVHTGKKARAFRAQLNGHPIAKYFSTTSPHGVRRLEASLSYGLRHGKNRLHVRVGKRSEWSRFRVWRGRPLVGAGVNQTVAVGSQVYLQGRVAAPRRRGGRSGSPAATRRAGDRSTTGWSLDSAPPASPPTAPSGASGRTAKFTPEVPGNYRLQLTGRAPNGKRGAATVGLTVLPSPEVPIDTMAKEDGHWGVSVGNQFYADPGNSQQWLQLVVLKADTLEFDKKDSKSYDCPQATDHPYVTDLAAVKPCTDQLQSDIRALKDSEQRLIVIAVSQRPDGTIARNSAWQAQPPVGALESLQPIGAPPTIRWLNTKTPLLRGRFSIIGSLGGVAKGGTLHANYDLNDLRDDGDINGFLLRDNKGELKLGLNDEYSTYASSEHIPFDTQAPGSNATTNVVRIGGNSLTDQIPPNSNGGFQVVILERQDLGGSSYFFNTGGHGGSDCPSCTALDELNRMTNTISDAIKNDDGRGLLVFISSVGDPRLYGAEPSMGPALQQQFDDAAKRFMDLLTTQFGATRSRLDRAIDPGVTHTGDWSYSLAAEQGTPVGKGVEAEGPHRNGLNGVPLVGSLTRSRIDYGFEFEPSQVGAEPGGPGAKLRQLVFSDPGPWPEQSAGGCQAHANDSDPATLDNPGCVAAVAYISDQTNIGTKRELFWSEAYDPADWDQKQKDIAKLKRPSGAGFSEADFEWAQNELSDEIGWLKLAHAFVNKLAQPFARNQLSAWSDVGTLSQQIYNDVKRPDSSTEAKAFAVFDAARQFAAVATAEIPLVSVPIETANILYDTAGEWAKIDAEGTSVETPFSVQAADAGAEIGKRLQLTQDTLQRQMVDVIASDYQKLRTVALCENLNNACPDPPLDQWQITPTYQSQMAQAINAGTQVDLYSALLPAQYRAWAPDLSPNRSIDWNGNQPAGQDIFAWHCPFHDEPSSANFAYPVRPQIGSTGGGSWQVVAYAQRTGSGHFRDPYEMNLPEAKVTDPLFKPVSQGGLGALPEAFYWTSFGSQATNPFSASGGTTESQWGFPLQDSQVRWISKNDPPGFKAPSCGY